MYWEEEASYFYYRHGPLARTVLGELKVQGIDYAYTLQGWLKGVNSTGLKTTQVTGDGTDCDGTGGFDNLLVNSRLSPYAPKYLAKSGIEFLPGFESNNIDNFEAYIDPALTGCGGTGTAGNDSYPLADNGFFDMGQDGRTDAVGFPVNTSNPLEFGNNTRTTDAYGFSLNYYNGDYSRIAASYINPFAALNMPLPTGEAGNTQTAMPLFNGNIAAMAVSIPKLGAAKVYGYNYDQLNRITNMYAFNGINSGSNSFTPIALQDYKEKVSYDANGNIISYKRNGVNAVVAGAPGGVDMDDLHYEYIPNSNKLKRVTDNPAFDGNYPDDIDHQTETENYVYDAIGNLIQDKAEGINSIEWNVYGKIEKIIKVKAGITTTISYTYDAGGNRISKTVSPLGSATKTTYYVRDASGNVMSVYEAGDVAVNNAALTQTEIHLYGSSRLGVYNVKLNVQQESRVFIPMTGTNDNAELFTFTRGNKFFELSNHLGNVLVTISDKKIVYDATGDGIAEYYSADVITANDYYPGGMLLPGRTYSSGSYRYSINGQEKESELNENITTAEFWEYDSRIGRRWNVDPRPNVSYSPYSTFQLNPIINIDILGDTTVAGAGGNISVDVDNQTNSLEFYGTENYTANGKSVPVQQGQLRTVSNVLGKFKAKWRLSSNGENEFAGYLNDENQTVEEAVAFAKSFKGRMLMKLGYLGGEIMKAKEEDPLGFDLRLAGNLMLISAMTAVEPVPYSGGFNPSVTTGESMSALGTLRFAAKAGTTALTNYWPANGGALGEWSYTMAMEGQIMDRYGSIYGSYASPVGTPFNMRALSPSTSTADYFQFEVLKPFPMRSSTIAPAFGKIGLGTQYQTPVGINYLEQLGYIKIIK